MAELVPALVTLRAQFNAAFPKRSKASDGWIGDPAHAARFSYHNPDKNGWVHAVDITHDPANGVDIDRITDELVASKDNRILELIANDLYWNYKNPRWVEYEGSNEHRKHFHISAKPGATAMDGRDWNLPILGGAKAPVTKPQAPASGGKRVLFYEPGKPVMEGEDVKALQKVLNAWYPSLRLVVDGAYGPRTRKAVLDLQRRARITVDGVVGERTRKVLGL